MYAYVNMLGVHKVKILSYVIFILSLLDNDNKNNGLGMVLKGLWDRFSQNKTCVQNDAVNLLSQIEGTSSKVQKYNENIYFHIFILHIVPCVKFCYKHSHPNHEKSPLNC